MSGVGGGDSISQEKFIESMQKLVHDPSLKGTLEGPLPLFFHAVDANSDGMISKEELENVIGPIIGKDTLDKPGMASPGDFEKHYSPLIESWYFRPGEELKGDIDEKTAFLLFSSKLE